MMTRAQNETCDVITAAAAAAAAEVGLSHSQNGDVVVTPSSSITHHQQALASPPPPSHGHRLDVRRALADSAMRHQSRPASDRYSTTTRSTLGGRFDDDAVSRRWLTGRVRNGAHGRVALPLDKRSSSGTATSLTTDSSASGPGHSAPLNLTCSQSQATDRRTVTPHQKNAVDDSCRVAQHADKDEDWCPLRRSWPAVAADCSPTAAINGIGATQRRSMSARSDVDETQAKVRRRTCWSVDNVSDEPKTRPTVARPSYDYLVLSRRRDRSHWSSALNSHQRTDMTTACHGTVARNSVDFLNYCNDVVTSTPSTPLAGHSSSVGGLHGISESVADRLLVDAAWSRVHPPSHDHDLHPGAGGRDAPARECSVIAQEPGTADDDDDDDALRQLLRLIQQPDGQPVFLCRHCDIIYADRMLYVLHMGLHNVNNPWQCNICGTTCSGRQQFALHALHY